MKKIIFTAILFTILNTNLSFGQEKAKELPVPNVTLCGATKDMDMVKYADLLKCDELMLPYKQLKIKSFTFSYALPADGKGDGIFIDINNTGSKFNNQILDVLKNAEAKKVYRLLIENVIVIDTDGKTERKFAGINIKVQK